MRVRTGTAGSSLLLTLVRIAFTEVSSASRSGLGLAAGIWCGGIIYCSRADGPRGTKEAHPSTRSAAVTISLNLDDIYLLQPVTARYGAWFWAPQQQLVITGMVASETIRAIAAAPLKPHIVPAGEKSPTQRSVHS